jgi:hypothetical protein
MEDVMKEKMDTLGVTVGFVGTSSVHKLKYAPDVDLGQYILASNPYNAVLPPEGVWDVPNPPPVIELDNGPYDVMFYLATSGIETHEKPGSWKFKYADQYVERALRIPYLYYKADGRSTKGKPLAVLVKDYFLVGFEGGAGY